ncbi:MAG: tRNA (adenosine(37)-N6)-threonylcarbamoyltransferase complex transferase subunit TsaD [Deltaproteobacteria bacterium]|nr:tRNA (adenosine(37)-N6)-threonylcarbamoyltransferase complex transferase subunit TsaD [Deltaproteobacteria bacterium]
MRILGIETSCDETAAAVVDGEGHVLSNVVSSQVPLHARFGGVVPELASRNHLLSILPVIRRALGEAGVTLETLTRVAVTRGPGLQGALLVGVQTAKVLAAALGLELVPVHHTEAHITAVFLAGGDLAGASPGFPYVALAVSGGHSSIFCVEAIGRYRRLGTTLDDAAGEAFDKVARLLDLPYPGGVAIQELAVRGDPARFPLPRGLRRKDSLDFSFSGLKTATRSLLEKLGSLDEVTRADLAASFQEAVVDSLVTKTLAAAAAEGVADVVVAGGVAANRRLRERFTEACGEQGLRLHLTAMAYCTDNAAMVAGLGRFLPPLPPAAVDGLEPFASGELGSPLP